jgi:hypothetical protein
MHITGNELTAASSVVAALAIIGGYFGMRSANENAVKISREERSSRQRDGLNALERKVYAQAMADLAMADLTALAAANIESSALVSAPKVGAQFRVEVLRRRMEALKAAAGSAAEIELISSNNLLRDLASEALDGASKATRDDAAAFTRGMSKLRVSLRYDLLGKELSSPEELNRMIDVALDKKALSLETAKEAPA